MTEKMNPHLQHPVFVRVLNDATGEEGEISLNADGTWEGRGQHFLQVVGREERLFRGDKDLILWVVAAIVRRDLGLTNDRPRRDGPLAAFKRLISRLRGQHGQHQK